MKSDPRNYSTKEATIDTLKYYFAFCDTFLVEK